MAIAAKPAVCSDLLTRPFEIPKSAGRARVAQPSLRATPAAGLRLRQALAPDQWIPPVRRAGRNASLLNSSGRKIPMPIRVLRKNGMAIT